MIWYKYKYYILIALVILSLWAIEYSKPKPLNWSESYSRYDKIPYGNYVLFDMLDDIFTSGIKVSDQKISKSPADPAETKNYIFINNRFEIDKEDLGSLLNYVLNGNNVFIAAGEIDPELSDTLNIETNLSFNTMIFDSTYLKVFHNNYAIKISPGKTLSVNSFINLDSSYLALGSVSDSLVNFIRIPYGAGSFFINLSSLSFTNFHMLKDNNHRYVSAVLSHLPDQPVVWDEYYKNRKNLFVKSPMYIIHKMKGMREALQLGLLSLLIYILFKIKRTQRIIPVIEPKINATVDFTKTVGQLYYDEHNNKDIGLKRLDYFLAEIRRKYKISTGELDNQFSEQLSLLSGVSKNDVEKLVSNCRIIKSAIQLSDERIIEQDKLIENFYKNSI